MIEAPAKPKQGVFDFDSLLGTYAGRTLLHVPEVCRILHRKKDYVLRLIDDKKLLGHSAGDASQSTKEVDRKQVLTTSVADWLCRTALYDGGAMEARLRDLFATLTPRQRRWAREELTRLLGSK